MIQRVIQHAPGTFATCANCRREPMHIQFDGRSRAEAEIKPVDFDAPASRHALGCARCGRATARHITLDAAELEWGAAHAQAALPLRVVSTKRRAA